MRTAAPEHGRVRSGGPDPAAVVLSLLPGREAGVADGFERGAEESLRFVGGPQAVSSVEHEVRAEI